MRSMRPAPCVMFCSESEVLQHAIRKRKISNQFVTVSGYIIGLFFSIYRCEGSPYESDEMMNSGK